MGFKDGLVGLLLGFGVAYSGSCDTDSYQPTACVTDMDCKGDNRYCGEDGMCHFFGDSGNGREDVEYTCESFSRMYVDECCPKMEPACEGGRYGPYVRAVDECYEDLDKGITLESLQPMWNCTKNKCYSDLTGNNLLSEVEECWNSYHP